MTYTVHVPFNGKRNIAIDFAIIESRLRAKERGTDICAWCENDAIEVLEFWHPYIPPVGVCEPCFKNWKESQLI